MPLNFNKNAQKGNQFINQLTLLLDNGKGKQYAGRVLKAIFKTLRDYLPLEDNFKIIAQLPMALKSVYIEAWRPTNKVERRRKKLEFIEQYVKYKDNDYLTKIEVVETATREINLVFIALRKYISNGEFENILSIMPTQIRKLIGNAVSTKSERVYKVKK